MKRALYFIPVLIVFVGLIIFGLQLKRHQRRKGHSSVGFRNGQQAHAQLPAGGFAASGADSNLVGFARRAFFDQCLGDLVPQLQG